MENKKDEIISAIAVIILFSLFIGAIWYGLHYLRSIPSPAENELTELEYIRAQ